MRIRTSAFLLAMLALVASEAAAQNLVVNGDFDTDLDGWTNVGAPQSIWDEFDEFEDPNSGSLRIVNSSSAGTTTVVRQCALAEADREFQVGFTHVTFPDGAEGAARMRLIWYANSTCEGATSGIEILDSSIAGPWTRVEEIVTSPPATQSVLIELGARKTAGSASNDYRVYFDEIYVPEPGASASIAAIFALAHMAQRRRHAR